MSNNQMDSTKAVYEQAERGAEFLDKAWPDWQYAISLGSLDLSDPHACVLGQLLGQPWREAEEWVGLALGAVGLADEDNSEAMTRFGFDLTGKVDDPPSRISSTTNWRRLINAWYDLIIERRA